VKSAITIPNIILGGKMSLLAKVNPTFVNIPGGTFKMGSGQWDATQPVESREMSAFQMMDAPVTVAQFKAYIESGEQRRFGQFIYGPDGQIAQTIWGPSVKALQKKTISQKAGQVIGNIHQLVSTIQEYEGRFSNVEDGVRRFLGDNKPVVIVDWHEAAAFCFAIGSRLSTEAQHEYAARAGRAGDDVYGTDSGELTADNAPWNRDGSVNATADVRSYPPNPWGLHDMTGNVCEWCGTWFSPNYKGLSAKDPSGSLIGSSRVLRGGSWCHDFRGDLLAAYRCDLRPGGRDYGVGFRAVRPQDS